MALATFNARNQIAQGRAQSPRRVEFHYRVNFVTHGDGTGLALNEDLAFADLPPGYVHERLDAILRTAEGAAVILDVGTEASPTLFANALNLNGTPNAKIQTETTTSADATTSSAAYVQAEAQSTVTLANELKADLNRLLGAGATYIHTKTEVRVRNPGATLIAAAIVDFTFVGYQVDTGTEK